MPARSESQRRAAGAELGRRRAGKKKKKGRAFGQATIQQLRDFARNPGRGASRAKVGNRPVRFVPPTQIQRGLPVGVPGRLRQFALGRRMR